MAATVQINEYNGASAGTKSAGVSRCDWINADLAATSDRRASNPLALPASGQHTYSFEKWNKLEVTAMGGSTSVDTIRHYVTTAVPSGYLLKTNAKTAGGGGPANQTTGVTPKNTIVPLVADTAMPESDPAEATITGTLTAAGESTFAVSQLDVTDAAAAGFSIVCQWRYREVA